MLWWPTIADQCYMTWSEILETLSKWLTCVDRDLWLSVLILALTRSFFCPWPEQWQAKAALNSSRNFPVWISKRKKKNPKTGWDITFGNEHFPPILDGEPEYQEDYFCPQTVQSMCVNTVPVLESLNSLWQTAVMWSKSLSAWQVSKTEWWMNNASLSKYL